MTDEKVPTLIYKQNTLFSAARFRFGEPDLNVSIEAADIRIVPDARERIHIYRISAGIEKKVLDNVWLQLSAGDDLAQSGAAKDSPFLRGGFRLGASEKPNLNLSK